MADPRKPAEKKRMRFTARLLRYAGIAPTAPLYERGRALVLYIMGILSLAVFAPVGISVIAAGSYLDGTVLLLAIAFLWLSLVLLRGGVGMRRAAMLAAASISVAMMYAIFFGGYRGFGTLYLFLSPIIFFYLLDFRQGIGFSALFSLFIAAAMMLPGLPVRQNADAEYLLRILILYILLSSLTGAVVYVFAQSQKRLQKVAFYDDLTGLPNRYLLRDLISSMILKTDREGASFAVFFVSISRLRNINDNYGYETGDEVIREFALRLEHSLPAGGFCGRFGGTDFIAGYPLRTRIPPERYAEEIHGRILKPFEPGDLHIRLSANISFLEYPAVRRNLFGSDENGGSGSAEGSNWADAEWIMKNLEVALDSVNGSSSGQTVRYDEGGHRDVRKRYLLTEALRSALGRGEIDLHYQPIISAGDLSVTKLEVLARWNSYSFGSVSPTVFIPMAEEQGLIREISEQLFARAMGQLPRLLEANAGDLVLSLNLSPVTLHSRSFIPLFRELIELHGGGLGNARIELEITESLFIQNDETVLENLNQLVAMGITLALDDFGTGYSSLSYLQRFSVGTIKIDRSFITSLQREGSSMEIVRAVIAMAKSLGIDTVAEGVEYAEQFDLLKELGCDQIQGFHFARPMPFDRVVGWLEQWRVNPGALTQ
jgi:EAL domain-containing protein (putative c-di-GMP-specific phosphodiesterase class I)/GGDEF domain-containing protein